MSLLAGPYKVKALYNPISVKQRLSLSLRLMISGLSSASVISKKPSSRDTKSHLHTSDLRLIKPHRSISLASSAVKTLISTIFIGVSVTGSMFWYRHIQRKTKVWYLQIGWARGLWTLVYSCLSVYSTGWWQMTLLGELYGHSLEPGLSISHLTRAISIENVCEHSWPFFFVVFIFAKPERMLSFAHALVYSHNKVTKREKVN